MRIHCWAVTMIACLFLTACQSASSSPSAAQPASPPPVSSTLSPQPAAPSPGVLASGQTMWADIVAEVIEFRRNGQILTAQLRLRNLAQNESTWMTVEFTYGHAAYVLDPVAGKKYELLRDEAGIAIASEGEAARRHLNDGFHASIYGRKSLILWAKFPAPPADVEAATLQMPGMPTFDLTIQDH